MSGLFESSSDNVNLETLVPGTPYVAMAKGASSSPGFRRQIDSATPTTSPSHCRANCAQSVTSLRSTKPSSRFTRAASDSCSSLTEIDTRAAGRCAAEPLRSGACCRTAPTAARSAGRDASLELSAESGILCNDFLIASAFDHRL